MGLLPIHCSFLKRLFYTRVIDSWLYPFLPVVIDVAFERQMTSIIIYRVWKAFNGCLSNVMSCPSHLVFFTPPLYLLVLIATTKVSRINTVVSRKREQRVLFMVVTMVVCYLLCWLPYGIMALMATFGRPGLITPAASIVPSLLAKTSTVINPIIYIFMNKQVGV